MPKLPSDRKIAEEIIKIYPEVKRLEKRLDELKKELKKRKAKELETQHSVAVAAPNGRVVLVNAPALRFNKEYFSEIFGEHKLPLVYKVTNQINTDVQPKSSDSKE